MKNIFNLQNKEFKDYIVRYMPYYISNILKEEISNKNLIRFYFEYVNYPPVLAAVGIEKMLFTYKLKKISNDRVFNFAEIVKSRTGISLLLDCNLYDTLRLKVVNKEMFDELIDIFLDEI